MPPPPIRSEPAAAAASTSAAAAASAQPDGLSGFAGLSGFGPTIFDALPPPRSPSDTGIGTETGRSSDPRSDPRSASAQAGSATRFDVCHVGVVLRTLAFVHGVVAIGALFGGQFGGQFGVGAGVGSAAANGLAAWLARVATGSGVALPALLLWLLVACAGKRALGALAPVWQGGAAIALGALSGAFGATLSAWLGVVDAIGDDELAAIAAGAAFAAVVFVWLGLRARAQLPADTAARLAELQARIRPHFLFNTLNTALALVRRDPARAESVLEDLAELFRVAISDSPAAATLAAEIELARRYLAIEQLRFGTRLRVRWEIDPVAGAARVPPLMLQPLVENAVRHGVEPGVDGGTIRIRTQVLLGRAVVSIANSVPAQASRPGHGMALRNVRERLRLMHDVDVRFSAHFSSRISANTSADTSAQFVAQSDAQIAPSVFRVRIDLPL